MAASWILVIIMAPKSAELSSPILPLDRFKSKIFLSSMILLKSIEDFTWPTMFLIIEDDKKRPTLFWIGAIASAWNRSGYLEYSSIQKALITGSVILLITFFLKVLSVSILMIPKSVLPGYSRRAMMALFKTYSSLGPQESAQIFLKTPKSPEATKCRCSGLTCSKTLKAKGYSKSEGLT